MSFFVLIRNCSGLRNLGPNICRIWTFELEPFFLPQITPVIDKILLYAVQSHFI